MASAFHGVDWQVRLKSIHRRINLGTVQMSVSAKDLAAMIPPSFTLGVATAAFQIEGAVNKDGRGPAAGMHLPPSLAQSLMGKALWLPATTTTGCPRTSP